MQVAGAAAFLSLAISMPALAADLPHRKPGLWEITHRGGSTIQYCIDAAADKMMLGIAGPLDPEACSKIDMQQSGYTVTIDFTCMVKGKPATAHTIISGSFESAYTMTWAVQGENLQAIPVKNGTTDGTWLGPCAADQRPGDIVKPALPNGARLNVLDMVKAKSPPL
jgi:Protein of unknown function (DUF3617)